MTTRQVLGSLSVGAICGTKKNTNSVSQIGIGAAIRKIGQQCAPNDAYIMLTSFGRPPSRWSLGPMKIVFRLSEALSREQAL